MAAVGVSCEVLRPSDAEYDAARQVWNGRISRRPALIVRCAAVEDVVGAVAVARDEGLELAVRGTGHNVAGFAVCEGGLVIDLSRLKGLRVDPARRAVRAEAGVTWGELDAAAEAFGLATTGGRISTTGVVGVTLGGGYGWLMRSRGLAVDNLRSAELVLADGQTVTASATENPDLFWAIRGGGGNFGVVTSLELRLHPIGPRVTGGVLYYPAGRTKELLLRYREVMASAPAELSALFNVVVAPPAPFVPSSLRGVRMAAIAVCHAGLPEAAERDLAPLRAARPAIDLLRPMRYTTLQRLFDAAGTFGHRVFGTSGHLRALDDDVVDTVVEHAEGMTSPLSIVMISPLGGAVASVGEHETAFSHRRTAFDYAVDSVWTDPRESERHMEWTGAFARAMRPFSTGVYVNELGDEGASRVREAYNPATYARLAALKSAYDPDNVFHLNQNIEPR